VIDGIAASLALTFLWTGWETGSAFQLGQTVTVFMAALVARAVTLPIARFMIDIQASDGPDHAVGLAFLGAFAALYGLLWIGVIQLTNEMRNFHQRGPGDRIIGAAIGAARGALMGLVIIIGITSLTYDRAGDAVYRSIERSRVGPFAEQYDFLGPFADKLEEEIAEREDRPPSGDRRWDVPR